jgi:hypothetical protein
MYRLEQELVDSFVVALKHTKSEFGGELKLTTEFNYNRGRTDIVAINTSSKIIAFEVKLEKWKEALHQAYRNTCFAHYSYIVVPESTAYRALKHSRDFSRISIGICYLSSTNQIVIPLNATQGEPLQKWLRDRARAAILKIGENARV